ncbi:MAG: peptidase [Rubellimicrobium sp.]|nr:peptidase [Rubellimicrobium sp.]
MTYCVALRMERGLVFMSDTRTNAGVDNISSYRKMFTWSDADAVVTILTAGNLATTQAVVSLLDERRQAGDDRRPALLAHASMFQVARHVGAVLREVIAASAPGGAGAEAAFSANLILGGQVRGGAPRLFLVYPEGNFIEAGEDTPFLQIGETKYGRPILLRAFDAGMGFEAAVKLLLLSFDSTIKANLSVGLPLDLAFYERDSLTPGPTRRIAADDPYFAAVSEGWGKALRSAVDSLPDFVL